MDKITVKVIGKNSPKKFQFTNLPRDNQHVEFVFDRDFRHYDWLFVYDDLKSSGDERLPVSEELLACARSRAILMTYEPSSIKYYGSDYVNQFGVVMTSQEFVSLTHANRIDMPPVGAWYYGDLEQVIAHPKPPKKTRSLSVVSSRKKMRHTLHAARYKFLTEIQRELGSEVDIYGYRFKSLERKADALDGYRYHIAVENHISPHHWTEKLSDCFLGYCLPFYAGCPNANAYFPEESFITIDMRDSPGAAEIIRKSIKDGEFEKRLPAIIEARRRVIEQYNLGKCIADYVATHHERTASAQIDGSFILSRHKMMRDRPCSFFRYGIRKVALRRYYRKHWREYLNAYELN